MATAEDPLVAALPRLTAASSSEKRERTRSHPSSSMGGSFPVDCRPLAASAAMEPSQVEAESLPRLPQRVFFEWTRLQERHLRRNALGARHLRKFMEFDSFVLNFVIGFRLNRGGLKGVPHGVRGVPLLYIS